MPQLLAKHNLFLARCQGLLAAGFLVHGDLTLTSHLTIIVEIRRSLRSNAKVARSLYRINISAQEQKLPAKSLLLLGVKDFLSYLQSVHNSRCQTDWDQRAFPIF